MGLETRLVNGGVNADDAVFSIGKNQILNAVNVKFNSDGDRQLANGARPIQGDSEIDVITSLLSINNPTYGTYKLLGRCADEEGNQYIFLQNFPNPSTGLASNSRVIKYNVNDGTAAILLQESWLPFGTGGFNWEDNIFIDCGVGGGKLFWVDPTPRYLDLSVDYSTYTDLKQSVLDLITEPTVVPLVTIDGTDSTVNSLIQFKALQFCVRLTNQSGFYSVLSPYSLTKLPVRQDEIIANGTDYHNIVGVQLPVTQKIPLNWQTIEYIVRDIETNGFYCIHTWERDSAADVVEVNNHNDGSIPLTFAGYYGINKYAIDSGSIAKQFDSVPLTASSLALVANRLFLGDVTDGYDTNNENSGFLNITQNLFNTNATASVAWGAGVQVDVISITAGTGMLLTSDFAQVLCIRDTTNSRTYLLPTNYFAIDYNKSIAIGATTKHLRATRPPTNISFSSLVFPTNQGDYLNGGYGLVTGGFELSVCVSIVNEAIGSALFTTTSPYLVVSINKFGTSNILDTSDSDAGGINTCFEPYASYKLGLQFYDGALRKSGVREYDTVDISSYGVINRSLTESIDIQVTNVSPSPVPDWAKYFSVTLSKEQRSNKTIDFTPPLIQVAIRNNDGKIYYGGYDFLTDPIPSYDVYGISISFTEMLKYGYGYDYKNGDFITLCGEASGVDLPIIVGRIIDYIDGNIIINYDTSRYADYETIISASGYYIGYDNIAPYDAWLVDSTGGTGATNRQSLVNCSLFIDTADLNDYEVAAFGGCSNSQFGNFFASGTDTITINGDHYTQARNSSAGGNTSPSYTPNEVQAKYVINNTGRVCAEDRIGQKILPSTFRWSNVNIPNATYSGYSTFDPLDYKAVDELAGGITRMLSTTKGVSEGGQLLLLCYADSFTTMVGKAQIISSTQDTAALGATTQVVSDINPITGGWGCQSPRSAVYLKGIAFWADVVSNVIVQFGANGGEDVSSFKFVRPMVRMLKTLDTDAKRMQVSACINGVSDEYIIIIPSYNVVAKEFLPTTTIENPLDVMYFDKRAWIFDWKNNVWNGSWQTQCDVLFNYEYDVFGWSDRLWQQFVASINQYGGVVKPSILTVPFTEGYPYSKRIMSLRFSGQGIPDETYITADGMNNNTSFGRIGVAVTAPYEYREGSYYAEILNDRLSANAGTTQEYDQNNFSGERLRGKIANVVMKWNNQQDFLIETISLETEMSEGQTNK